MDHPAPNQQLPPRRSKMAPHWYILSIAVVIAATIIRLVFLGSLGLGVAFITFYPAVMVAALYGGLWAGLLATALSVLATAFFFIEPTSQLAINQTSDWLSMAIFFLSCTMISFVTEAMRRAQARLAVYHDHLEGLVKERTTELENEVNERKQVEQDLRQSDEILHLFIENVPAPFAMFDLQMRYLAASRRWKSEFQLIGKEIIGKSHYEIFPGIPERWKEVHRRALAGETLRSEEDSFNQFDGTIQLLRWEVLPWRKADGAIGGILIFSEDITKRKQNENALQESEERFRTMANAIPQLAWIAHADGYIFWYNQRWFEYTGTTLEQMKGWGWQSVHDPEKIPKVLDRWKSSIATGDPFDMDIPLRRADGVFRPFLTKVMPLKDSEGRVVQWFGTNTDVTEYKKMEQSLRDSESQLKIQNENLENTVIERTQQVRSLSKALTVAEQRERQRFSQILHENLQQTLFGAKMQLDLVDCGAPESSKENIQDIALVKQLILKAITTTKSLAIELNPPILKTEGLDAALKWLAKHMEERYGLTTFIDVSKDLSNIQDVDQILIIQLTRELLFNILQHARTKEVVLAGKKIDGGIVITLEDKGVGFDVEEVRKRDIHKSGMGFFSIEERLRLFGGKLEIHSEPNKGTQVTITIPMSEAY